MVECEFSPYLGSLAPAIESLVRGLEARYGYASVLAADTRGFECRTTPTEAAFDESPLIERGFVARVQKAGRVAEFAFNHFDGAEAALRRLTPALDALLESEGAAAYPPIAEAPLSASTRTGVLIDPFSADPAGILARLDGISRSILSGSPKIVHAIAKVEFMAVSKLFVSSRRRLSQAYIWSDGFMLALASDGSAAKDYYASVSGRKGLELIEEMPPLVPELCRDAVSLLVAGSVVPGEYDVICSPDVAGLIAHEAFGHGVELDTFVKGRARAADYMGKPVASPLVTMYEGALGAENTGSYDFDDEGSSATRTTVIENGILKAGISDQLSALRLGSAPTGNGRRQAYDHKAYARMTNTWFAPGADKLEAMIASIEDGYLLDRFSSGMEDPRNWGIQLVVLMGREIKGGKLTGRVVSPVIGSGYVPDVLSAISMVSGEVSLNGGGMCGKGHKELVKNSSGGPYIKTKLRLG